MKTINHYTLVNQAEILGTFHCDYLMKVDEFLKYNESDFVIKSILQTNKTSNSDTEDNYFVAALEKLNKENNEERIGILQVKLFADANFDKLQTELNDYLFENRFKVKVKKITYTSNCTIAVEYYIMNQYERDITKGIEQSYLNESEHIKVELSHGRSFMCHAKQM